MQDKVSFSVDVKGAVTNKQYRGLFSVRVKTTHRDTIRQDEIRRSVLGESPQHASIEAQQLAHAYAYLATRIVDAPPWWKETDGGLNCEDDEVLIEVNNACVAAITKERTPLVKEAEKAREELTAKRDPEAVE